MLDFAVLYSLKCQCLLPLSVTSNPSTGGGLPVEAPGITAGRRRTQGVPAFRSRGTVLPLAFRGEHVMSRAFSPPALRTIKRGHHLEPVRCERKVEDHMRDEIGP
jgi:hypothetical protein